MITFSPSLTLRLISILTLVCLFSQNSTASENYALLVGISGYHIKPLSGPANDARLFKSILAKKWSFKEHNITLILDQDGTKRNILNSIKSLYKKSKAGDNIFIYLSGHGTSAQDSAFKSPLPTTSGAFIPVDIKNVKSSTDLIEHLIIGRKDLKPLLQQFDRNGRHVFVAIDACFSGNTVRGLYSEHKLTSRYLNTDDILATRGFNTKTSADSTPLTDRTTAAEDTRYPYNNIYYLAASGEYEPAQDIKPTMLSRYPTIDGKPHGAFSDTLLRVLNDDIHADNNGDGIISYAELKNAVRDTMRLRGFNHTPQGLPSLAEDKAQLASRGIFGQTTKKVFNQIANNTVFTTTITETTTQKLSLKKFFEPSIQSNTTFMRVKIAPSLTTVRQRSKKINNIKLVNSNAQLELRTQGDSVLLISHAGDLIKTLSKPSPALLIDNIKNQLWIKQLLDNPFKQDFNIQLDMFASGRSNTVVAGDTVGVAIKSTQTAHILIININAHGTVTVLYPYTDSELDKLAAYKLLVFKALSKVVAPFGREYLQLYAFKDSSADYRALKAKSFDRHSSDASRLKRLLQDNTIQKARTSLELVTSALN